MACRRIAGVAYIFVDGAQYPLRGDLTVSIDTIEREGVAGMDGVHGFTETPRVPWIEGSTLRSRWPVTRRPAGDL